MPTNLQTQGLRNGGRKGISSKTNRRETERIQVRESNEVQRGSSKRETGRQTGPKGLVQRRLEWSIYAGEKQEMAAWTATMSSPPGPELTTKGAAEED